MRATGDFCGDGVGSTAPPCFFVGQLSPSGGRRLALALPATSSVLPRGLGCALGRARSWLLLCRRLSGRAEGVLLPASSGGHLSRRGWRAGPTTVLGPRGPSCA